MYHSIKEIGKRRKILSDLRGDNPPFNPDDFFAFAEENKTKYTIEESGDDLIVSSWDVDELIKNYKEK